MNLKICFNIRDNRPFRKILQMSFFKVAYRPAMAGNRTNNNAWWFDGIFGCLKPVWLAMGKNKQHQIEKGWF